MILNTCYCRKIFKTHCLTKICSRLTYHALRRLQIEINIFNMANRHTVFAFRTGLLGGAIVLESLAIQLFYERQYTLALMNGYLGMQCVTTFAFLYGKGFSVPRSCQKLITSLKLRLQEDRESQNQTDVIYLLKQARSLRIKGFTIGSFHYLQRSSVPLFVDFALKHIIRSIIVLRRFRVGG